MGNGRKSKGHKHKGKKPKPAPVEEEPAAENDEYDDEADEFFQFGLQVGFNLELRLEDPAQFEEALAMFRDTVTREKMSLAAADAKKNLCAVMMREAKDEAKDDASPVDGEAERRHAGYVWREANVGAPAPRDDRFGARSNSRTSLPPIAAARARASTSKCPQVAKAPLWRAFAAFVQSDVGNFAYFVERVDPFDVRFTLPVVMCVHVIEGGFIEAFHLPFDQEAFTTIFGRAVTNEARENPVSEDPRPFF
ncbi:hypothetical protein JL720_1481 [Aureococcus anophagefferens]|nr:hypothetical protein JL720_1481 [Aureococcus anophagefferens]